MAKGSKKGKGKWKPAVQKERQHWAQKAGLGKAAAKAFKVAGIPPPAARSGAAHAAAQAASAGKSKKDKKKARRQGSNAIVPYKQGQRILLVGEGNFSFAAALSRVIGGASGIDATAHDSDEAVAAKYPDAADNTAVVLGTGGAVHCGVDGTHLKTCRELEPPYDSVVFNFPHCGLGIKDKARNVAANQALVVRFARSAAEMVHDEGEIHITVKRGEPYDSWKVPKTVLEAVPGLRLKNSFDFDPVLYPGYCHRRTLGFAEGVSAEGNEEILRAGSKTYVFARAAKPPPSDKRS